MAVVDHPSLPLREEAPPLSVLLPLRDAAAHLEECLESLAAQTRTDFELVAVDDGSEDDTRELLAAFARRHPSFGHRLRLLTRPRRGLIPALEEGLAHCRGRFVARMDGDDRCPPDRLALQVDALEARPSLGGVGGLVRCFPRRSLGGGFRRYEAWLNGLVEPEAIARERFVESPLAHPSVMLRREVLEEERRRSDAVYREVPWAEDYDLWLRLLDRGVAFAKVERVVLHWRDHPDRATRRDDRYALDRFLECKAHHLTAPGGPLDPAATSAPILWGAGKTGRRLTRALADHGVRPRALLDIDPRKVGPERRASHYLGIPMHPPEDLPVLLRASEPQPVVITAVGAPGARELIRGHLVGLGLVEGVGFWCAA